MMMMMNLLTETMRRLSCTNAHSQDEVAKVCTMKHGNCNFFYNIFIMARKVDCDTVNCDTVLLKIIRSLQVSTVSKLVSK